jgi:Haloacid dehalogenase-like hydrolase
MLAATRGIKVSDADPAELTDRFATMPPHPEVPAALRRLRDHGFRLFTLTDNTLEISGRQLDRTGVIDVFERRFSVDETVRRHKPAPEAYRSVATALETDPAGICLSPATSGTPSALPRPAGRPRSSSARATPPSTSAHSRTTSARTSTRSPTS